MVHSKGLQSLVMVYGLIHDLIIVVAIGLTAINCSIINGQWFEWLNQWFDVWRKVCSMSKQKQHTCTSASVSEHTSIDVWKNVILKGCQVEHLKMCPDELYQIYEYTFAMPKNQCVSVIIDLKHITYICFICKVYIVPCVFQPFLSIKASTLTNEAYRRLNSCCASHFFFTGFFNPHLSMLQNAQ